MKTIVTLLSIKIIFFVTAITAFSQSPNYDYIINNNASAYSLEEAQKAIIMEPVTPEEKTNKAFRFFRFAVETESLEYLYNSDPVLRNPIVLAYTCVAQALVDRDIKGPGKQLRNFRGGVDKIDKAIILGKEEGDNYAMGFLYFLRVQLISNVPIFMRISKETEPTFQNSLNHFKKVVLTKEKNGDMMAELFGAYADYLRRRGRIKLAIANLEIAVEQAYNPSMRGKFQKKLDRLN